MSSSQVVQISCDGDMVFHFGAHLVLGSVDSDVDCIS